MFKGIVQSGFNEGSYYVAKYSDLFESSVGFSPFPGTLNVLMNIALPDTKRTITPDGNFHPVDCHQILINKKYKGAIVIPHKSRHIGIVEIIAPINLRKELQLQDGDEIECELV